MASLKRSTSPPPPPAPKKICTNSATANNAGSDADVGSTVITLNVGGKTFATRRRNLTRHPHSYFSVLFAREKRSPNATGDTYFIERDPRHFDAFIDYLRGGIDYDACVPRNERYLLAAHFDYFQIPRPIRNNKNDDDDDNDEIELRNTDPTTRQGRSHIDNVSQLNTYLRCNNNVVQMCETFPDHKKPPRNLFYKAYGADNNPVVFGVVCSRNVVSESWSENDGVGLTYLKNVPGGVQQGVILFALKTWKVSIVNHSDVPGELKWTKNYMEVRAHAMHAEPQFIMMWLFNVVSRELRFTINGADIGVSVTLPPTVDMHKGFVQVGGAGSYSFL